RSDRHSEFPESNQQTIAALEDALLKTADRVLYVSYALMSEDQPTVGNRGVFIDHGVDLEHFSTRAESEQPAQLRVLPRPRIGFFGGLDDYVVDIDLIERLADEIPHAQIVLVGAATCPMDRFERYPNVHWFGFQPYSDIPGFGSGFDVAIMPWLDNDWIRLCNPIKLKEYLALGLPVVSIDYPQLHAYDGLVSVARGGDEFVAALRAALETGGVGTPELRRAAVLDASWDAVAERLLGIGDDARSSVS
ncbi:MAG: glycosyltransferase, partial [Geodermatophilaceae bacterium]